MMSPEEREIALDAERVFMRHLSIEVRVPGRGISHRICHRCRIEWPCGPILTAREMTANLTEEVD